MYATGEIRAVSLPYRSGVGDNSALSSLTSDANSKNALKLVSNVVSIDSRGICDATPGKGLAPRGVRFTRRGRQTLKEFGAVVEEEHGRRAVFLTWTLPGHGEAAFSALSAWSSYISSRLAQWLRDTVPGVLYAWVYEHQQRGALHQHLVVAGPSYLDLTRMAYLFPRFLARLLGQVSEMSGVDLFYNTDKQTDNREHFLKGIRAEWVEKSAARYLAKYVSKTANVGGSGLPYAPVRWWRVNNAALTLIKERRDAFSVECSSADDAARIVDQVVRAGTIYGADSFRYANREFPWLANVLMSFDLAQWGRVCLETAAALLEQTHTVLRCNKADILRAREELEARVAAVWAAARAAPWAVLCPVRVIQGLTPN